MNRAEESERKYRKAKYKTITKNNPISTVSRWKGIPADAYRLYRILEIRWFGTISPVAWRLSNRGRTIAILAPASRATPEVRKTRSNASLF